DTEIVTGEAHALVELLAGGQVDIGTRRGAFRGRRGVGLRRRGRILRGGLLGRGRIGGLGRGRLTGRAFLFRRGVSAFGGGRVGVRGFFAGAFGFREAGAGLVRDIDHCARDLEIAQRRVAAAGRHGVQAVDGVLQERFVTLGDERRPFGRVAQL